MERFSWVRGARGAGYSRQIQEEMALTFHRAPIFSCWRDRTLEPRDLAEETKFGAYVLHAVVLYSDHIANPRRRNPSPQSSHCRYIRNLAMLCFCRDR